MQGNGISTCFKCSVPIGDDKLGYCKDCLDYLDDDHPDSLTDFYTMLQLQKYAADRQKEVRAFLEDPEFKIEHIKKYQVNKAIVDRKRVFGILSPNLAASLDYTLVHQVSKIEEIDQYRRKWLTEYWFNNYEIEVPDFANQVGLVFVSYSQWHDGTYSSVYDYPDSLVQAYVVRTRKTKIN